jgi:hypothetical protein
MDTTAVVTGATFASAAGTPTYPDVVVTLIGATSHFGGGAILPAPVPGIAAPPGTKGAPRPPAPPQGTRLDLGSMLHNLVSVHPDLGEALRRVQDSINEMADNTGVSSIGPLPAPPPLQSVQIKTAGEMVHFAINHQAPISKSIKYFTEVATEPSFAQPVVYDHGASRTPPPITLPTKDDNGNPVNYYFRHYSQYHGSPASPILTYGGNVPAPVTLTGGTQMTLLPSTGSGTASPAGTQGGQGAGSVQFRPPTGPKRSDMNN